MTMPKPSEESESSKQVFNRRIPPPRQLAPGAMVDVLKIIADQPNAVEFISCVKVPDAYAGDFFEYQPVSITVKDGKIVYAAYVGEQAAHIDEAVNNATQWVDKYFYELD